MRSTSFIFILAAASAPAYGAPLNLKNTFCDRYPTTCTTDIVARQDDSEALSLSMLWNGAKDVFKVGKAIFDENSNNNQQQQQQQQRDFVDFDTLVARADEESGAINWVPIASAGTKVLPWVTDRLQDYVDDNQNQPPTNQQQKQRRKFIEMLARAAADDETGALSLNAIWDVAKAGYHAVKGIIDGSGSSSSSSNQQQSRDFIELMARAAVDDDETGALSLSTIWDVAKAGYNVVKSLVEGSSNSSQQQSRDFVELSARNGANFTPVPKTPLSFIDTTAEYANVVRGFTLD
ncbi:uncharacterized protein PHACADRAFT_204934 [Phanerochaete carnosa HHB-10118-sp]|uniref:Uncharacterized protein n=1 Tax=Phanerochaete carnosa (strain HHB-10118-sp) TaxID=650164 RepID=K5WR95_PHACS|nr:uncharacterized protein PHACADRAFT_204934 [Phanerochaete carnosa HHB-10118-sp]EKM61779.1 hypothetical protein PHACADRAFT_204934 [Phanerochaete carnosa HHB-10118-sp]